MGHTGEAQLCGPWRETLMHAISRGAFAPVCATREHAVSSTAERHRLFGEELDALRRRVFADVGPEDVAYVRRLNRFSRAMEGVGRGLIHFSFEPVGFVAGVAALFVHKQLQAAEVGHTALHGAYDGLPGAEA